MEFLCSQCGACCKSVGKTNGAKFGLPIKEDGSCANLVGNLCSIYDDRPEICRVDALYEKHFKKFKVSKKDFFIYNTKVCHKLIDDIGLSEDYKIDIEKYN